ncbi:MAG TPA: class I SAM-dependent methyltransferase [Opitutaceae bacterium]|nr:class I SAM-dependent methyltransferase [Opitutaceae bacterium]
MICRVCDSTRLTPAVDLGTQPWANHFLKPAEIGHEPVYPLKVVLCEDCGTVQLDYTVPKETMFADHTYLSGTTKTLSDHFQSVARAVDQRYFSGHTTKAMLDIGSNDGTQLRQYRDLGYDILGVEPAKLPSDLANAEGLTTLRAFFNEETAKNLGRTFQVINASGVFFHLEELHSVTRGIRACLADNGVFVIQFLYMKRIVENDAFDQIYHEHLLYYNVRTLDTLLRRHGLALFDAELSPIHGGSIIAHATHAEKAQPSARLQAFIAEEDHVGANTLPWYQAFARRIAQRREENRAFLQACQAAGKRVFGLGAPVKGNTLLNYYGIGPDLIECLVERNPHRRGLTAPGSHIPVRIEDELTGPPDVYYVLAWNFKKEILARYASLIAQGVEFYFPVNPKDA